MPGCDDVGAGSPQCVSALAVVLGATACSSSGEQRRTADLQRPARVADQGVDRRVHQGDRHQGDLPAGRRHRTRQPADRRGRRVARRRLPHRELPRDGRCRERRAVRRPRRRDHRSGSGAIPSGHRQVDRRRRAHDGVRLQQGQAAARSAAEIHAGPASSPRGRAAGAGLRPRPTSRPSSPRCSSSRASRPPRSGWPA